MRQEKLSLGQAISILVLFILGSSIVVGGSVEAGQDVWASLLISMAFMVPFTFLYGRLTKLYPESDLYDIVEILFGKVIGKVFVLVMTWYALHLGSLVLRNFSEFINITALPETPQIAIMILMILVTIYLAKSGIFTMGKWSVLVLPFVCVIIIFTVLASFKYMDVSNLRPILEHRTSDLLKGAYKLFTFPFAEIVVTTSLLSSVKKSVSPYKIYFLSLLLGGFILLVAVLRNLLVLGTSLVETSYFPSYMSARIISVGKAITRIEGSISINYIIFGISKITVCLIAASKGISKLIGSSNYKNMVFPVGMLILSLCSILFKNIMEMYQFLKVYQYYAVPFEVVIPAIIWIFAEIRSKHGKQVLQ